ncbi:MAG: Lin0512 family protein [Candidatus Rokubacteria bacterium]|nr:Lin0512 family protein [Candidatus Rokubacteria bacterium]
MSAKAYVLEFGMGVDVTVGVPDPASVKVDVVRRELPHGEVTVRAVSGGLRVPGSDTLIACAAITVSVDSPQSPR